MLAIKAIFRLIIGIIFGAGSALAISPALAAFNTSDDSIAPYLVLPIIVLSGVICFFAPTIRRAFGRAFLLLGVSVFALPISAFLLSGRAASEVVNAADEGSEALAVVGAGLAGAAVTGVATFFGLIMGAILLLAGIILSLGGRREVVVFEASRRREPSITE